MLRNCKQCNFIQLLYFYYSFFDVAIISAIFGHKKTTFIPCSTPHKPIVCFTSVNYMSITRHLKKKLFFFCCNLHEEKSGAFRITPKCKPLSELILQAPSIE